MRQTVAVSADSLLAMAAAVSSSSSSPSSAAFKFISLIDRRRFMSTSDGALLLPPQSRSPNSAIQPGDCGVRIFSAGLRLRLPLQTAGGEVSDSGREAVVTWLASRVERRVPRLDRRESPPAAGRGLASDGVGSGDENRRTEPSRPPESEVHKFVKFMAGLQLYKHSE